MNQNHQALSASNNNGVLTYLDVANRHVSQPTMEWLEAMAGTNEIRQTVASYEYGCFISVPPEPVYHASVPADLRTVLDFARAKNCVIVRLDAHGYEYEELPDFEW